MVTMGDLIDRQDAIEALHKKCITEGLLDEFDTEDTLRKLPSAEPNNQVHLCDFCKYSYPECPADKDDIIFGNGRGHDNICACAKFEIKPERKAKVYKKQAPDRWYYFYCGACGEMIDTSSYEDYKGIKSYCGYCGAKLDWSEQYLIATVPDVAHAEEVDDE